MKPALLIRSVFPVAERMLFAASLISLSAVPGCGGGSSGTGVYGTGVRSEKALADLSKDEAEELCAGYKRFVDGLAPVERRCRLDGLITGAFTEALSPDNDPAEACSAAEAYCLANPDSEDTIQLVQECPRINEANLKACPYTVGDLVECLDVTADYWIELATKYQCTDVPELLSSTSSPFEPKLEACQKIEEQCPEIFEDDSEDQTN